MAFLIQQWGNSGFASLFSDAITIILLNLVKCHFIDSIHRNKKETHSYFEILRTVGIDRPSDMLFVTDVFQEAVAARAAGNFLPVGNNFSFILFVKNMFFFCLLHLVFFLIIQRIDENVL